jgi:hypothetical protein
MSNGSSAAPKQPVPVAALSFHGHIETPKLICEEPVDRKSSQQDTVKRRHNSAEPRKKIVSFCILPEYVQ